jgi:2-amino-4-hydroxy-6-hydroxymethyldihydropteridine diphosphokinase
MFHTAYLLLGSNMGNRINYIQKALDAIFLLPNTAIVQQSKLYETAAWGNEKLPPHINVAIAITTRFTAEELLLHLQQIENKLDRTRQTKWGERTIDIDIIFFDKDVIETSTLNVPHPLMQERRFVLTPLHEIASEYVHPIFQQTINDLLKMCKDPLAVRVFAMD